MANEITITTGLKVVNGNLKVTIASTATQFNQTTAKGGGPGTVAIGTSEETISFGDIAPGWVLLRNLDDTNYVNWGNVTANLDQRLPPTNGVALFYLESGGVLIMQANTAECIVEIIALNA